MRHNNQRGVITIFVSLLLIPSIALSGFLIDIGRMRALEGKLTNASQLAATSIITQYDGLLNDIYGLFGLTHTDTDFNDIAEKISKAVFDDEIMLYEEAYLTGIINELINSIIIDKNEKSSSIDLMQYILNDTTVSLDNDLSLANNTLFKMQLLDFMKYRGPYELLLGGFLEIKDKIENIDENVDTIEKKVDLDDSMSKLAELYEDYYYVVRYVDIYTEYHEAVTLQYIKEHYNKLNNEIESLYELLSEMNTSKQPVHIYINEEPSEVETISEDELRELERKIKECQDNIVKYAKAGIKMMEETVFSDSELKNHKPETGNHKYVERSVPDLTNDRCYTCLYDAQEQLERIAKEIDEEAESAKKKLRELEASMQNNNDKEFVNQLEAEIKAYQPLIGTNFSQLSLSFTIKNKTHINNISNFINSILYDYKMYGAYTITFLSQAQYVELLTYDDITYVMGGHTNFSLSDYPEKNYTTKITSLIDVNKDVYDEIKKFAGSKNNEEKSKGIINTIKGVISNIKEKFLPINNDFDGQPLIASEISNMFSSIVSQELSFNSFSDSDFDDMGESTKGIKKLLEEIKKLFDISETGADLINKALVTQYAVSMFSNITTNKTKDEENSNEYIQDKTITNVNFSKDVNYLFQSELEYIFLGNNSMDANHTSVTFILIAIRFLFNYIATFNNDEVKSLLNAVNVAVSAIATPFVGNLIKELLRAAFALAESYTDVSRLKAGETVNLIKSKFYLSLEGIINDIGSAMQESISTSVSTSSNDKAGSGTLPLTYENYMTVFLFVFTNEETIINRVKNLIELNINYYGGYVTTVNNGSASVNGNSNKVEGKNVLPFSLLKSYTSVTVELEGELKYLFLPWNIFKSAGINASKYSYKVSCIRGY